MDVCKCIVPARHRGTLNNRRVASPLVRLVEGEDRWEASDHPQSVLPPNRGGIEPNRTVTCMELKATANNRRHLALCHDEFRGPRSGLCRSGPYAQHEIVSSIPEASLKTRNTQDSNIYSCDRCSYTTFYTANLKKHTLIHTRKRFKCDECGQSLASKSGLEAHLFLHTGEKPFKCPKCFESFRHKCQLIEHGAYHKYS
ncbi:zinc finger protein [Trichonephila clavipes]|nr:zinc finger protein [Trichonephila clavipes]